MKVIDPDAPLVLIETGCGPEGLDDPVVTKDDRITNVQLTWDHPMPLDMMQEAVRVLGPLRGAHPRFDAALDRLHRLIQPTPEEGEE